MKKHIISIIILLTLWATLWVFLYNYEKDFPNASILEFSQNIFSDITSVEIVKDNDEFDVYRNGNKLMRVTALKDNRDWKVSLVDRYIEPIKIFVPSGSEVYVEDKLLSYENKTLYTPLDRYDLVKEENRYPRLECYECRNYVEIPNIKVLNNGEICDLDTNSRSVIASRRLDDKGLEELRGVLLETAKLYARYITNDARYSELSEYLYKNTELYKELGKFFNDWYGHSGYEFRNVKTSNIRQVADNAFYGDVLFDYIQKKGKKEFKFSSNYQIYFIKVDDQWKAICIDVK